MNLFAHNLFDGKRIRALTIADNFSRDRLAIDSDFSIKGDHLVGIIETVEQVRNRWRDRIQLDHGNEFISKALDQWTYENVVVLDFSIPSKKQIVPLSNRSMVASSLNV